SPRASSRAGPIFPWVWSESDWPSLPENSSSAAQRLSRPERARSRSPKWASEIFSSPSDPWGTSTASRSQSWAGGFAKTTFVSSANSYPPGAAGRCNIVFSPAHCVQPQGRLGSGARVDDKLQEIEHKFDRLTADLGDPAVLADPARIKALMKERSQLEPLVETFRDFKRVRDDLRQHEALLEDADADMRQMAKDELPQIKERLTRLEAKLKILLLPKDPNDERDVILEVRAGAGGDEAGLF